MIYLLEAVGAGHVKIGFTADDVQLRIDDLQTGSSFPLRLLGTMPGDKETEKDLHRRFASSKVLGEWFQASPEIVGLVLPQAKSCQKYDTATKSVQIKALTVGRKQFSQSLLRQLPRAIFLEWGNVWEDFTALLKDGMTPDQLAAMDPKQFENNDCDYWGWVKSEPVEIYDPHMGVHYPTPSKEMIFESGGILYRDRVTIEFNAADCCPERPDARLRTALEKFWIHYRIARLGDSQQLFVGV